MISGAYAVATCAGVAAALLQFAGALKTSPALGWLPLDLTMLAAGATLLLLPAMLAMGGWRIGRGAALPLLAATAIWPWWCIAALWSPAGDAAAAKLGMMVLACPPMLLAGLLIGADAQARRALAAAVIVIALAVGASVGWGLLTDSVVLGGEVGADPELLRVQYQLAGLAIATAGGLAAVQVAGARGWVRLPWMLLLGLLCAAVMLPGGRASLLALALAVLLLPAWRFWLGGKPRAALGWFALAALGGAMVFALLALQFDLLERLRALERLMEGAVSETRPQIWADALRLSGWLGIGPGAYPQAAGFGDDRGMHPHNHALEALVEAGLPGLALWCLAFGGALLLLVMRGGRVAPGRAAVILALVLPMAVTVMVSTDLSNRMAWFALGLALSVGVERVRVV